VGDGLPASGGHCSQRVQPRFAIHDLAEKARSPGSKDRRPPKKRSPIIGGFLSTDLTENLPSERRTLVSKLMLGFAAVASSLTGLGRVGCIVTTRH
jgi:hypothetical protein